MSTLVKVGIGVAVVAIAVAVVPALKGPYNRVKNTANEKLSQEFVVDNYKAEYIKLHERKIDITANIQKFKVEQAVAEKKLAYAKDKMAVAKKNLVETGTADLVAFNRAKDAFESSKVEASNYVAMINAYSNALVKLENSLYLVETNMSKAKTNVATLESKKVLVDSIKSVNMTVESLKGVGDTQLGMSVEKLNDDVLRESIKLEALQETESPKMNKDQAEAYLKTLD